MQHLRSIFKNLPLLDQFGIQKRHLPPLVISTIKQFDSDHRKGDDQNNYNNHDEAKSDNNHHHDHYYHNAQNKHVGKFKVATMLASSVIIMNTSGGGGGQGGRTGDRGYTSKQPRLMQELSNAVLDGDEKKVRNLVRKLTPDDLNSRHEFGWQLIHVAAVNGYATICQILLENGATLDSIDHYRTPYDVANRLHVDPIVVALTRDTDFRPSLSRINYYGCTPLHYAAISNDLATVEVLLRRGANPNILNEMNHMPINYAQPVVSEVLSEYSADYEERKKRIEAEEKKRYPLEKRIKEKIIGQEAAISIVAATIRRKENGWFDEDHPLVFLFLGSSGIGKTELAKQIATYLHKTKKEGFIRLDMSEYQEKHSVSRMIGSPPGYVGYPDGGQLTDALRKCPDAVVLFDEVEKAHPDVLTILLQLFDEGRLTDGKGQTIACKNAIFIMTSNLASEEIAKHALHLRAEQQELRSRQMSLLDSNDKEKLDNVEEQVTISSQFKETIVRRVLKNHFMRDEFLGRINEMVYFLPFSDTELRLLVEKELKFWRDRAKTRNHIELTWDDEVIDVICKGYNVHYGARSIKYEVERRIVNMISELQNSMPDITKAHISVNLDKTGKDLITIKLN